MVLPTPAPGASLAHMRLLMMLAEVSVATSRSGPRVLLTRAHMRRIRQALPELSAAFAEPLVAYVVSHMHLAVSQAMGQPTSTFSWFIAANQAVVDSVSGERAEGQGLHQDGNAKYLRVVLHFAEHGVEVGL
jgi:hypothetical protein